MASSVRPLTATDREKGAAINGRSIDVALILYHPIPLAHVIEEKRDARKKRRRSSDAAEMTIRPMVSDVRSLTKSDGRKIVVVHHLLLKMLWWLKRQDLTKYVLIVLWRHPQHQLQARQNPSCHRTNHLQQKDP